MKVVALHKDEQRLIEEVRLQNRQAQRLLYERFAPKMLSVCRMYIKDIHEAEDVMIGGFMKVFTHIDRFAFQGSFEGWIRKIMIRESLSYLRAAKKITFLDDVTDATTTYDPHFEKINVDQIQQCIDELPEGCSMVFNLYVVEGYKHHEIAEMLQISEGTSKSQLFFARKLLKNALQKLESKHYGTT
jgi:RNA polymerase sigma factor (sigma-70 family)